MPRSVDKKRGRNPRLPDHELMAAVTRIAGRNRRAHPEDRWDRDLWRSYAEEDDDDGGGAANAAPSGRGRAS